MYPTGIRNLNGLGDVLMDDKSVTDVQPTELLLWELMAIEYALRKIVNLLPEVDAALKECNEEITLMRSRFHDAREKFERISRRFGA